MVSFDTAMDAGNPAGVTVPFGASLASDWKRVPLRS